MSANTFVPNLLHVAWGILSLCRIYHFHALRIHDINRAEIRHSVLSVTTGHAHDAE